MYIQTILELPDGRLTKRLALQAIKDKVGWFDVWKKLRGQSIMNFNMIKRKDGQWRLKPEKISANIWEEESLKCIERVKLAEFNIIHKDMLYDERDRDICLLKSNT